MSGFEHFICLFSVYFLQVYPYGKLHRTDDLNMTVMDGHDARGHSNWIKLIEQNPHILIPEYRQ